MNKKLNYNYELQYFIGENLAITIEPPFTIEFEIMRKNIGASNIGSIRIYNLKEEARSIIRKDFRTYDFLNSVILKAGYGDELSEICNMSVNNAWSVREGVNFITQISLGDGGYAVLNGTVDVSFSAQTNVKEMLLRMAKLGQEQGLGVRPGAISPTFSDQVIPRGNSYSGSWWEIINELSGNTANIDSSKLNLLKESEYINQEVVVVNAASGLLGTPVRATEYVEFEMLFEPKISPGILIKLETLTGTEDVNNTFYVVQELGHRGMISESIAGSVFTNVSCYAGFGSGVNAETSR